MRIICYTVGVKLPGAKVRVRNPDTFRGPEFGFDFVIANRQSIIEAYAKIGVPEYNFEEKVDETQEERQEQKEVQVDQSLQEIHEKIVEQEQTAADGVMEMSWVEKRRYIKEVTGQSVKNLKEADEILKNLL